MRQSGELDPGLDGRDRAGGVGGTAADLDLPPSGFAAQSDKHAFVEELDPAAAVLRLVGFDIKTDDLGAPQAAGIARFFAAALSGDTSIRRLEDIGEGAANQFAMAKAIASGDERLMQKAGLEADIARLERLRAAHEDDQYAVRRQMRDAEREIEISTRRIGEIGQDIARLEPTSGDAFTMMVLGQKYTERTEAGRALMKEILTLLQLQQKGEVRLATIGGFDLVYEGERFGKGDGYRYETLLQRTGADYEIDLAITVTPLGAISRLEHALGGFDEEQRQYRRRLEDAERRLVSFRSRDGGAFAFADDLTEKRLKLSGVEEALAASAREDAEAKTIAA